MSKYGSKTNSEGKVTQANGGMPTIAGPCVEGNTIAYFGMSKDQNGEPVTNRAEIRFNQSNGASFTKSFFDGDQDWAIDNLNRDMLHICTKIVSEADYYAAVEGATDFQSFIGAIATKVIPQAEGKKFNLKITYSQNKNENSQNFGKWYIGTPKFPNWIEPEGTTPSTFKTNPKYDFYAIPEETATDTTADADVTADSTGTADVF